MKGAGERERFSWLIMGKKVGALLQAVASLSLCFEDFKHIPKIAEAKSQFEALKEECSNLV